MIQLTDRQIEYLMCIYEENNINITKLSKNFNCSKVNSKNIVDRMIKLGIIYKDNNNLNLTYIGQKLAKDYKIKKENLRSLLATVLDTKTEYLDKYVNSLLSNELEKLSDRLVELEKRRMTLKKMEKIIGYKELKEIFKDENIKISFLILKKNNSFSMAMKGFKQDAYIDMKNREIVLNIAEIIKKFNGFNKNGFLKSLEVHGREINVSQDSVKIPIELVKDWSNIKNGIIMSVIDIKLKANISFNLSHNHSAKFIFIINIFQIS